MKNIIYLLLILTAALLGACHKDPPKTYDDTDMTISYYNTGFDFQQYTTFVMPDSMVLTSNYLEDDDIEKIYADGGTSDQALALLRDRFLGLGYTEVDSLTQADFIPVPTLLMTKADQTVYYGPGWWWGGYYPSWGWGFGWSWKSTSYWYPIYPWYPPTVPVTVSTYTGTIVYEIIDAASYRAILEWNQQNPGSGAEAPEMEINWQAQIQGYSTDDGSYNQERALRGTDEAFAQSPYLVKN